MKATTLHSQKRAAQQGAVEEGIVTIDLDSTLADTTHRHHLIDRSGGLTDWHAYSWACGEDKPIPGAVALVRLLNRAGYEVHALSARMATSLEPTLAWYDLYDIPITATWLDDDTSPKNYSATYTHADYKLARARSVEKVTGKKILLHIDDYASVSQAFNFAGIPTMCVRTPEEILQLTDQDLA